MKHVNQLVAAFILVLPLSACSGMRFVVDLMPADYGLGETTVLGDDGASDKIAMIELTGLISNGKRSRFPMGAGENPVSRFVESFDRAEKDRRVKGVLLVINSPGGTVTASDMLYREVLDFKARTGKPVVVLMEDVAASGGFYVACAGDEIIAHPTTVTGSIGVIIQTFNFAGGMQKIGIRADAITSGSNKAMGSPFEPMPETHRALLQGMVDEFYENFLGVVATGRPDLAPDQLSWITDGRVITGRRAAEVGLVDRVGTLRDAFRLTRIRADAPRARLVKYHRAIEHVGSPYAVAPSTGTEVNLVKLNVPESPHGAEPGFYYLWDPASW